MVFLKFVFSCLVPKGAILLSFFMFSLAVNRKYVTTKEFECFPYAILLVRIYFELQMKK